MTTRGKRLAQLEARAPQPSRCPDVSHLTNLQLELIERCVDRSSRQWDQAALAALPEPHAGALLATLQSIDGRGYRHLREIFMIAYSERVQARVDRLDVISGR